MVGISANILRFAPVTDLEGMHGLNEHIGVDEYKKSDWFLLSVDEEVEIIFVISTVGRNLHQTIL